jgi:glycosyltransferase involved in cell wall biosynthesis
MLAGAIALRGLPQSALVATQHFLEPAHARRRGIKALPGHLAHRWVASRCGRIVAISRAVRDGMIQRGEADERKITVIHNGLDDCAAGPIAPAVAVRAGFGISAAAKLVVCAARLEWEKDVASLIEAMAILGKTQPDVQCIVAGRGSQQAELERRIGELGLMKNVRLAGFIADVPSLMAAADVVVLPSLAEPFGLVIVEAMSLSKPVVATRAGGPPEIIEDKVSGLLVAPRSPAELAGAIGYLTRDAAVADNMGQEARARFEGHFTAARMAADIAGVYEQVLANR